MSNFKWISFLLLISVEAWSAPSGTDLLKACEESLANGFHGSTGMMCIWYVTPCDCHHGKDIAIPRVCLPDNEPHELLAREVVEGLKSQPELQTVIAEIAVGVILSPRYPCNWLVTRASKFYAASFLISDPYSSDKAKS